MNNKKLSTISKISREIHNRMKMLKNKTINLQISVSNKDISGLGVIAKDYQRDIGEIDRMLTTIDKMVEDLKGE